MIALCVDDEPLLLRSLTRKVEKCASIDQAFSFGRGEDAIEWAADHEVDIAFLDLNLGSITGLEVAEAISVNHPNIPVIFCTGYSMDTIDTSHINEVGYLMKPIMADDLAKIVKKVNM